MAVLMNVFRNDLFLRNFMAPITGISFTGFHFCWRIKMDTLEKLLCTEQMIFKFVIFFLQGMLALGLAFHGMFQAFD